MFKLEVLGFFLWRGGIWVGVGFVVQCGEGGLGVEKGCFRLNIMFSGYF